MDWNGARAPSLEDFERLADEAVARLPEAFRARYVHTVPNPATGTLQESLREGKGGRCPLLEGANTCSVYTDRPEHCRTFPYWPSVLGDAKGFQRAAEVCPGIRVGYLAPGAAAGAVPGERVENFTTRYQPANRVLEIEFEQPLERFRTVQVELLEGIEGTDGQLLEPWTLLFTTGAS